jgi:uncharacterized membrane protein
MPFTATPFAPMRALYASAGTAQEAESIISSIQRGDPQLLIRNSLSKHRIHVLDGMRGIAAIIVMLYHVSAKFHLNPFLFLKIMPLLR